MMSDIVNVLVGILNQQVSDVTGRYICKCMYDMGDTAEATTLYV
jgi:hypothetical protein